MPLGPSQYLPKIDLFAAHWEDVDAALAPTPMELPGGYARADLLSDRTALAAQMATVQAEINQWDAARTNRDNAKEALHDRMKQLANYIRGMFPQSENFGQLRPMVDMTASQGSWLIHLDKAQDTWLQINTDPPAGFTPPLLLLGGYTQAQFVTDANLLRGYFTEVTNTLDNATNERSARDRLWEDIYDHLNGYRAAVIALLGEDHALSQTIPRLSPLPGHTPDPVILSGVWNATTLKADLTWTASEDEDLAQYEVRRCIGPTYDTDFEMSVAIVPKEETAYSTNEGLTLAGNIASFKVYVVLLTDNEAGSNAVAIQHPGGPIPPPE